MTAPHLTRTYSKWLETSNFTDFHQFSSRVVFPHAVRHLSHDGRFSLSNVVAHDARVGGGPEKWCRLTFSIVEAETRTVLLHFRFQVAVPSNDFHLEHPVLILYCPNLRMATAGKHCILVVIQGCQNTSMNRSKMSGVETRKVARLVDNSPDGWVLVQKDLPYDAFEWQQIITQVDMSYMAHAFKGGRNLTPHRKQPLQASTASDSDKSVLMLENFAHPVTHVVLSRLLP